MSSKMFRLPQRLQLCRMTNELLNAPFRQREEGFQGNELGRQTDRQDSKTCPPNWMGGVERRRARLNRGLRCLHLTVVVPLR